MNAVLKDERYRLPCNEHLVDRCYDVANVISELDSEFAIVRHVEIGASKPTLHLAKSPTLPGSALPSDIMRKENGHPRRFQRLLYKNCILEWPA